MLTTRPAGEVVHWPASGQVAHARPKRAVPASLLLRRIGATFPAGQDTVSASRSMPKRSLAKRPVALTGGWVLQRAWMPARARRSNSSPVP